MQLMVYIAHLHQACHRTPASLRLTAHRTEPRSRRKSDTSAFSSSSACHNASFSIVNCRCKTNSSKSTARQWVCKNTQCPSAERKDASQAAKGRPGQTHLPHHKHTMSLRLKRPERKYNNNDNNNIIIIKIIKNNNHNNK